MSLYPESITSEAAKAAMEAHTNINTLGAIIALCENSLLHGERTHKLEAKVIALCVKEQKAQLVLMDKATGRKQQ